MDKLAAPEFTCLSRASLALSAGLEAQLYVSEDGRHYIFKQAPLAR